MRTDGQTGRQTDMKKLTAAFRNSANPPKSERCHVKDTESEDLAGEHTGVWADIASR